MIKLFSCVQIPLLNFIQGRPGLFLFYDQISGILYDEQSTYLTIGNVFGSGEAYALRTTYCYLVQNKHKM